MGDHGHAPGAGAFVDDLAEALLVDAVQLRRGFIQAVLSR
jgi:hypothetical protein